MSEYLSISDAAKEVQVESHVLRYWEEELSLSIHRNELGHRIFTKEDIERLKQIKDMKERGLQLKAIKMILKDGKLDVIRDEENIAEKDHEKDQEKDQRKENNDMSTRQEVMAIDIVSSREVETTDGSREEKLKRMQWLMSQLIQDTLRQNNQELCKELKESVIKELDYQFRAREEKEEERERLQVQRDEKYYSAMDELLRRKSKRGLLFGRKRKDTP